MFEHINSRSPETGKPVKHLTGFFVGPPNEFEVYSVAGAEGIEPPTFGFGDRHSAN